MLGSLLGYTFFMETTEPRFTGGGWKLRDLGSGLCGVGFRV